MNAHLLISFQKRLPVPIRKDRWSLVSLLPLNKEMVIWNAGGGWESNVDIVVIGQTLVPKEPFPFFRDITNKCKWL